MEKDAPKEASAPPAAEGPGSEAPPPPYTQVACAVCYAPPDDNRKCQRCQAVYCRECLARWYQHQTQSPHCPSCRLEAPLSAYLHNAELQASLDVIEVSCDFCQASMPSVERTRHMLVCRAEEIGCPYAGCSFVASRSQMDVHTVTCAFSDQYSPDAILNYVCRRNTQESHEAALRHPSLLEDLYRPDDTRDDGETLVHYVQPHDTMAGIAIKYKCSAREILRLNRLSHETQLFGRATLIVPRPPGWTPRKEPEVPMSVLLALKKRRLTRELMRKHSLSEDEAIVYLHLTSFHVDSAAKLAKEDQHWTVKHRSKQPATLTEFLQRLAEGPGRCHGCDGRLPDERRHCSNCGRIFCHTCQESRGQCKQAVPKAALGATSPATKESLVAVCNTCFHSLRPASQPPPAALAPLPSPQAV